MTIPRTPHEWAEYYEQSGQFGLAAMELEKLGEFSHAADLWRRDGQMTHTLQCLVKAGRHSEVAAIRNQVNPGDFESTLSLVAHDAKAPSVGRTSALEFLEAAYRDLPDKYYLTTVGDLWEALGRFDKALTIWESLGDWVAVTSTLVKMGRLDDAKSIIQRLHRGELNHEPRETSPESRVAQEARQLVGDGRLDTAGLLFEALGAARCLWREEWCEYAASLYAKLGDKERATQLYHLAGRPAKASRILGTLRYDIAEAAKPVHAINSLLEEILSTSWRATVADIHYDKLEWSAERLIVEFLKRPADASRPLDLRALLILLRGRGMHAGPGHTDLLRKLEVALRASLSWSSAAALYLAHDDYESFERVCREEDELEVAALWYERAGMPERQARILEMLARAEAPHTNGPSPQARQAKPPTALVCPACGAKVEPNWILCPECNEPLGTRTCECGQRLKPHWTTCPACGSSVAPTGLR